MQVIKIYHYGKDPHTTYRTCQETSTFLFDGEKTLEEIQNDIKSIRDKKIEAFKRLQNQKNNPTGYFSRIIDNFPDHYTIAQAKQELQEKLEAWEIKCREEAIINCSFDQYMEGLGYIPINSYKPKNYIVLNWPNDDNNYFKKG